MSERVLVGLFITSAFEQHDLCGTIVYNSPSRQLSGVGMRASNALRVRRLLAVAAMGLGLSIPSAGLVAVHAATLQVESTWNGQTVHSGQTYTLTDESTWN
jgi:hypothetical protein